MTSLEQQLVKIGETVPTSRHLFIYLRDIHAATWRLYSDWRETIFKASYFFLPLYIFSVLTHQRLSTPTAQINFERVVFAYIGPSPCESPSPLLLKQYHVRERERERRDCIPCVPSYKGCDKLFMGAARLQSRFTGKKQWVTKTHFFPLSPNQSTLSFCNGTHLLTVRTM